MSRVVPLLCIDEGALTSDLSLHKAGDSTAHETQVSYKHLVQYLNVCAQVFTSNELCVAKCCLGSS